MREELERFVRGISTFAWNADFFQFCKVCGFDPTTAYAKEKWDSFKELQRGLTAFDLGKLEAIVKAGSREC